MHRLASEDRDRRAFFDALFRRKTVYECPVAQNPEEAREADRIVTRNLHAASVVVWAGASATSRTPLVFVENVVKIKADVYVDTILKKRVLPWSLGHYKQRKWTFQQDGAPAQKAAGVVPQPPQGFHQCGGMAREFP
ncbi:hypothetical protein ANCCEY_09006 [Ancylostoma ceylanicum]|uniref:Uncharacterized protein n=1 Tax=Ancylostoma ceylanicum TaxID=53326 RepID=A0A0D6LPD9_9BILA|nr:hypothetical protein ANCCEY_09006 [Ancylostoma ceylanicum]